MIYITFFFTVFILLYMLFLVPSKKKQHVQERMAAYLEGKELKNQAGQQDRVKPSPIKHLFKWTWSNGARLFKKRMTNSKIEKIELKLSKAGNPLQMTPFDFRLLQVTSVVGFPVICGLMGYSLNLGSSVLFLFVLFGFGFGLLIPNTMINAKIKKRAKSALKELPDFVDLLTVSLEAGLGFDSALNKVTQKQKGVLADEFHRCLDEIRLGKTRREGLSGIKKRLDVDEISTLINSVIRAEKLGVGMVQVLRIQSAEVREKRKQRAEEQAMKAPIKILFPLVLFIFPSLFIIILGPAAIQIIHAFK